MSYAIPAYHDEPAEAAVYRPSDLVFVDRSRWQWVPFLIPSAFCGVSWYEHGIPVLTDAGFLIFTVLCAVFLAVEFYRFPQRFGIGGLVLWGGTLCWFCEDYFVRWFGNNFQDMRSYMEPWVIAKCACLLCVFTMFMSIGIGIRKGRWLERIILAVPDMGDSSFYLFLVLLMFVVGISPYYLFNAPGETWYMCMYHAAFAGWTGGPRMTVFRDGNLNYHWGAYAAQLIQIGQVGGLFAMLYAIMITRNWFNRAISICIWGFWVMVAFQTDRRGEIAFSLLPPIAILFIQYQARAAMLFKKFSLKSYVVCGLLTVALFFIVQYQGAARGLGFAATDTNTIEWGKNQGNTMFSEGLLGYRVVGESMPFFRDKDYSLQGLIMPLPDTAFWFFVGPIPRALWHGKPVDGLWSWYNQYFTGTGNGVSGTTISHGLTGCWYFKYGPIGMLEGALLVGWLMGISERALQNSNGRPIGILMSLGVATWLFRTYRDFIFIDLYGLMIGAAMLSIITYIMRPFFQGDQPTA